MLFLPHLTLLVATCSSLLTVLAANDNPITNVTIAHTPLQQTIGTHTFSISSPITRLFLFLSYAIFCDGRLTIRITLGNPFRLVIENVGDLFAAAAFVLVPPNGTILLGDRAAHGYAPINDFIPPKVPLAVNPSNFSTNDTFRLSVYGTCILPDEKNIVLEATPDVSGNWTIIPYIQFSSEHTERMVIYIDINPIWFAPYLR
jgi:hypothetical protein